jgi:hypothetical protein
MFTGDMPSHDVWQQTVQDNNMAINHSMNSLAQYFGADKVYTVLGNHEPHPLNV